VESVVTSVNQLTAAGSLGEAFIVQSNYILARSEIAVACAKSMADDLGRPFSESAKSVQESFAKAA
jgi:hypothetical protein